LARTKSFHGWQCFFEGISACSQSGNHPYRYLAKCGYKKDIKRKYLITLLYFWLQIENKILKSDNFYFFVSPMAIENLQKSLYFTTNFNG